MSNTLLVKINDKTFTARLETERAPKTCAAFVSRLPFISKIVHVRWSGEAVWAPLGDYDLGVGFENATSYAHPGEFLFYPGGVSETEILLSYGCSAFASKAGQLAGNHFLTLTSGLDEIAAIGRDTLWTGAKSIEFHLA